MRQSQTTPPSSALPCSRPPGPANLFPHLLRARRDLFQVLTLLDIRKALSGCRSVLDVGCGNSSPISLLGFEHLVGIDAYGPAVAAARSKQTHNEIVLGDVRELDRLFQPGQFEGCVAIDVIEHLTEEEGLRLARSMETVASKKVVFFTPNGFLTQHHSEQGDLQEHHSGWRPADMERLGYQVRGMLGPKTLRGENHVLRFRPRLFWGVVSLFAQLCWSRRHPDSAAAILCTKSVSREEKPQTKPQITNSHEQT